MSAEPAEKPVWTPEAYLAWERKQPEKHEFFQGEIFAMAGASREHNLIVANLVRLLGNALLDRPYEAYPSDMRVRIPATGLYTYPDVSVVCGGPVFEDDTFDTLLNPGVLIKVLSDATEAYDRGRKAEQYRSILSIREHVLVSQDRVLVEQYTREPDGSWRFREHRAGERFELSSIGCSLSVDESYLKVFGLTP